MPSNHSTPDAGDPPIEQGAMAITVRPEYASEHSDPRAWRYVFAYHITIENVGVETGQLFWRHWLIHDLVAGDHEVEGEGVVGESPVLRPGESHEYQSFCILRGPTGHMEGFYHFRRRDGSVFRAPIPRFHFHAPPEAVGTLFS
ncbi:Co2+/Mg2+ efflux protein ApaG [Candidatus Palauibacter sp.]|uniref:Co2+/Mg2+ efflux protein ApaG n=1 Tax=Candidatus Palauibacter sp. TaxID=3101350 RepID=UPI003B01E29D